MRRIALRGRSFRGAGWSEAQLRSGDFLKILATLRYTSLHFYLAEALRRRSHSHACRALSSCFQKERPFGQGGDPSAATAGRAQRVLRCGAWCVEWQRVEEAGRPDERFDRRHGHCAMHLDTGPGRSALLACEPCREAQGRQTDVTAMGLQMMMLRLEMARSFLFSEL